MKSLPLFGLLFMLNLAWGKTLRIDPILNRDRLLRSFDQDQDKKITILDQNAHKDPFYLKDLKGGVTEIRGVYHLSNLLQELTKSSEIKTEYIFENPVDRISRLIRTSYWDALTRVIDHKHLKSVMPDAKIDQPQKNILYVPESDLETQKYFSKDKTINVKVVPKNYDLAFLKSLRKKHGLLTLKPETPYVVPGGRFNEMYGWDSYFQILGLLHDQRLDLAKGLVDNLVYEITHYGKILNANRSYYLARSQPPLLTSMIREVHAQLNDEVWLRTSLAAAIDEYEKFWMANGHVTDIGLNRYFGIAPEIPPEVEPGHFDKVLGPLAKKHKLTIAQFQEAFNSGKITEPELHTYLSHDQAVRESGHDTTYRWKVKDKDVCADFVTVDLNSLLYKTELDIAYLIEKHFKGKMNQHQSSDFYARAKKRKKLMQKYLWREGQGFFDYNWKDQKHSDYQSATNLYPLWANLINEKEAKLLVEKILPQLEVKGGLASTSLTSLNSVGGEIHERQWDYPYGWAPHQMLIWQGLEQYGFEQVAQRLIYKWLYMITKNAMDYNGTIPEKYDVVRASHEVFAEYGNVGTKFSYITREGFGWMNASYQIGISKLSPLNLKKLKQMESPD